MHVGSVTSRGYFVLHKFFFIFFKLSAIDLVKSIFRAEKREFEKGDIYCIYIKKI